MKFRNYRTEFFTTQEKEIMHITKTLFTEFTTTPKLAWFHVHDKETYNQILEAEYGAMDGAQIGQSIEDQVKALL